MTSPASATSATAATGASPQRPWIANGRHVGSPPAPTMRQPALTGIAAGALLVTLGLACLSARNHIHIVHIAH